MSDKLKRVNEQFNQKTKGDTVFLPLGKLFFIFILFYMGWFQWVFEGVPHLTLLLGAVMIAFLLFHSLLYKKSIIQVITFEILIWMIFAMLSLGIGVYVAINTGYLFDSIITYIQYLMLIFAMVYISLREKRINFIINAYILLAIVCALTTKFWGVYVFSNRISMSISMNPNTTAITMVLGVFCVLFQLNLNRKVISLVQLSAIFLFIYIILLTASRNGFLCLFVLLFFWIVVVGKDSIKELKNTHIFYKIFLLAIAVLAISFIVNEFLYSNLMLRVKDISEGGTKDTREIMINYGIQLFKEKPIIGYGLDNFKAYFYTGSYSHNTYIEVLVSTGLLGAIIYFIPYISLTIKTLILSNKSNSNVSKEAKLFFGLMLVLIVLGMGVIHFYNFNSMIAFGFLITFCSLHYCKGVKSQEIIKGQKLMSS